MNIGIIPARAGSKRFPGKNKALLNGVPLWLRAALMSIQTMDDTIISTDDQEIISGSPYKISERPEHLRDGMSYRIDDVLLDMVGSCGFSGCDVLYLFQPATPFLNPGTIEVCLTAMLNWPEAESVQTLFPVSNILHAYSQRVINGWVAFAFPELREKHFNSQKKVPHYAFAGFVGCRVKALCENGNIWGTRSIGVITHMFEGFDIDTEEDLKYAESFIASQLAV